jgi:cytochrome c oxidase subunit 4
MPGHVVSPATLVVVLLSLLLLTGLTVGVSFLNLPGSWHLGCGVAIATAKAALVLLFFMHVIDSSAATQAVIVVAFFWLIGILMALTLGDYATRDKVALPAASSTDLLIAMREPA